jgi:hypothetical protein
MKMVKKTLIAIALVAFLASTAPADITVYYFGPIKGGWLDHESGVKSDGNKKVYWPYEWKELPICAIDLKMEIGMYVDVKNCKTDKKIVLHQVDCTESGFGEVRPDEEFPCYAGCEDIQVRANFDVKINTDIPDKDDYGVIDKWSDYFPDGDVIPGDGSYHKIDVCIKTWKTKIYKGTVGSEVKIGTLMITAKPDMDPAWSVGDASFTPDKR